MIVVSISDSTMKFFIAVENSLLASMNHTMKDAVVTLISTYFAVNMVYPKELYAVLIFLQHCMLQLKDQQRVPNGVTIASSTMLKL